MLRRLIDRGLFRIYVRKDFLEDLPSNLDKKVILLDATVLVSHSYFRGTGAYLQGLITSVSESESASIALVIPNIFKKSLVKDRLTPIMDKGFANVSVYQVNVFRKSRIQLYRAARKAFTANLMRLDCPYLVIDPFHPSRFTILPLPHVYKNVFSLCHDILPLQYHELLTSSGKRLDFREGLELLRGCKKVFPVSIRTSELIHRLFPKVHQLAPLYGAPSVGITHLDYRQASKSRRGFVIVGEIQSHKNLFKGIEAYQALPLDLRSQHSLQILGIRNLALSTKEVQRLKEDGIYFTGMVNQKEYAEIISSAKALFMPSLEEGLGLPLFDSWLCQTPALVGKLTSMSEIIQDLSLMFDPRSVQDMSRILYKTIEDSEFYETLVSNMLSRRLKHNWGSVTGNIISAISVSQKP